MVVAVEGRWEMRMVMAEGCIYIGQRNHLPRLTTTIPSHELQSTITIHHPPPIMYHRPPTIHHPLSVLHHLQLIPYHPSSSNTHHPPSPSTSLHSSCAFHHRHESFILCPAPPLPITYQPPSTTARYPPFTHHLPPIIIIHHPPSPYTTLCPSSPTISQPSSVLFLHSSCTIHRPQAFILSLDPPLLFHHPQFSTTTVHHFSAPSVSHHPKFTWCKPITLESSWTPQPHLYLS